eukprot:CAMPEP_0170510930 /NCGR_PEP_ID=MMETSP0208-20121228/66028_1 /TAXON_ID=197538 /ORGANISM="Strombidium inclinatum, Strain S3" /LENGTH=122 /DNA_ID=CAMNT_0010794425 /DNA_START=510 /DNA_END=878 /DNA_ORIENTATION=+
MTVVLLLFLGHLELLLGLLSVGFRLDRLEDSLILRIDLRLTESNDSSSHFLAEATNRINDEDGHVLIFNNIPSPRHEQVAPQRVAYLRHAGSVKEDELGVRLEVCHDTFGSFVGRIVLVADS